jgi:hypothetical protein
LHNVAGPAERRYVARVEHAVRPRGTHPERIDLES